MVSVVVVSEEGDRVEDCLASVRGQTHPLLDVVRQPGRSRPAAELPDDPRFRAIAPSATSYDAVRAGIAAATGRYVVLVRGCDQLLPHAVTDLAGSLSASGSDLATGVLEQTGEPEPWLARAQADAHAEPGPARPCRPRWPATSRSPTRRSPVTWPAGCSLMPATTGCAPRRWPACCRGWSSTSWIVPVARFAWGRGHRAYGARPSPLPELDALARPCTRRSRRRRSGHRSPPAGCGTGTTCSCRASSRTPSVADEATWGRLVGLSAVPDGLDLGASSRSLLGLAADGRRCGRAGARRRARVAGRRHPDRADRRRDRSRCGARSTSPRRPAAGWRRDPDRSPGRPGGRGVRRARRRPVGARRRRRPRREPDRASRSRRTASSRRWSRASTARPTGGPRRASSPRQKERRG